MLHSRRHLGLCACLRRVWLAVGLAWHQMPKAEGVVGALFPVLVREAKRRRQEGLLRRKVLMGGWGLQVPLGHWLDCDLVFGGQWEAQC